jgi:membrane protein implicated in regulation of membrane protease activity
MYHWVLVLPLLGLILFIFLTWRLALPFYLAILVVSLGAYWKIVQAQRQRPAMGRKSMIGGQAVVVWVKGSDIEVEYKGETWRALCPQALHQGQHVMIEGVDGLTLRVVPLMSGDDITP